MKRSRRRGSATLELLVMLPVMIGLMAVSFWATSLYDAKMNAAKMARAAVFTSASRGCVTERSPVTFEPKGESSDVTNAADLGVIYRKLPRAPGGDLLDRAITDQSAKIMPPEVTNGLVSVKASVTGKASMTCNEVSADGDPKALKRLSTSSFDPRSP